MAIVFPLLFPLLGVALIILNKEHFAIPIAFCAACLTFLACVACIFLVEGREVVFGGAFFSLFWTPLGGLFVCFSSFLWIINTLYSVGYCQAHSLSKQKRFQCFFCLSMASTMLAGLSANLFTLLIAYELLTLCTFPLICHSGSNKGRENARFYLMLLMGASAFFLIPAILWTLHIAGTTSFTQGGILPSSTSDWNLLLLTMMYAIGLGKMALFPVHQWLPRAMVASVPVSALLHAVAVVKTGAFALIMVAQDIIGLSLLSGSWAAIALGTLGSLTLLWAAFVALRQDDLKKRLAYSTISQLAYVAVGISLASPLAIGGVALHMLTHACAKMVLFMSAGNIMIVQKKHLISTFRNLFTHMPITLIAFAIAGASLVGLPPMIGLASKGWLLFSAVEEHAYDVLIVLLVGSFVAFLYLGQVVWESLKDKPSVASSRFSHAHAINTRLPKSCQAATVITTLMLVLLWPLLPLIVTFLQG